MDRLIEFVTNHALLVLALAVLVILLAYTESRRGGKTLTPQGVVVMINRDDAQVVDLRKVDEFGEGHIAGSLNVPYDDLEQRLSELRSGDKPLILVCDNGTRSGPAGRYLSQQGLKNIWRMNGGLNAWRSEKLPLVTA